MGPKDDAFGERYPCGGFRRSERMGSGLKLSNSTARGKLPLPQGDLSEQLESQGFVLLSVPPRHIDASRSLTCAHADPFERLLIAQACYEGLTLPARDAAILGLGLEGVMEG